MVKRNVNAGQGEPEQQDFQLPSKKEHLLQVVEIYDCEDNPHPKISLDEDTVVLKLEVVGGEEEGRSLLHRISLNQEGKGFFATRLFLKAIGEEYHGDITIDTDMWVGWQFYATVIHNGKYANIDKYNFDKKVDNSNVPGTKKEKTKGPSGEEVAWDE